MSNNLNVKLKLSKDLESKLKSIILCLEEREFNKIFVHSISRFPKIKKGAKK